MIEDLALQDLPKDNPTSGENIVKKDAAVYGHVKAKLEVVVGSAEISISELLQLKAGSVVQMLETIQSPMLLKMDGKVVASGSLVVVDDKFGFEVTDVID